MVTLDNKKTIIVSKGWTQIDPCMTSGLSEKFQDNPFISFSLMLLKKHGSCNNNDDNDANDDDDNDGNNNDDDDDDDDNNDNNNDNKETIYPRGVM